MFITKDVLAFFFFFFITKYASVNATDVTINCNKAPSGGAARMCSSEWMLQCSREGVCVCIFKVL